MLNTPIKIRSFADELESSFEKQALDVTLPMVTSLLGAGTGGLVGYKTTREPNKKLRNAIAAALIGGGAGYGLGKAIDTPGAAAKPPPTVQDLGKKLQEARAAPGQAQEALVRKIEGDLAAAKQMAAVAEAQRAALLGASGAVTTGATGAARRFGVPVSPVPPSAEITPVEAAANASFPASPGTVYSGGRG